MAQPQQRGGKKPLAALIAAACIVAAPVVVEFEGTIRKAYLDPVKIPTICTGHTGPDVFIGRVATDGECRDILDHDLKRHAEGVAQCTPMIFDRPKVAAAATSLAFNIGVSAYCRSTAAKRFRAGNYRGGCEALGWFNKAGGKVLRGLQKRRAAEVKLCLEGVG